MPAKVIPFQPNVANHVLISGFVDGTILIDEFSTLDEAKTASQDETIDSFT